MKLCSTMLQSSQARPVLTAVKEQLYHRSSSKNLSNSSWTQEQWWESFHFLFVVIEECSAAACGRNQLERSDDLLFFVHSKALFSKNSDKGDVIANTSLDHNGMPFSVRRRGKTLSSDWQKSGRNFAAISWDETLLLNLVVQTHFSLTTIVCRESLLSQVASGLTICEDILVVTKRVYASPVQTSVSLQQPEAKMNEFSSRHSYPNVCFAVENFVDAFSDMVMSHKEDCYCVLLHTSHTPTLDKNDPQSRAETSPVQGLDSGASVSLTSESMQKMVLFSGYVTYSQVHSLLDARSKQAQADIGSMFRRLFGRKPVQDASPKERVQMTGPGGVGQAEVAVQQLQVEAASSTTGTSDGDLQPADEDGKTGGVDRATSGLQCALMSMWLPIDKLAAYVVESLTS
ncbi:hypothetical protein CEUSTIGMA_g2956.t1 [Chlamydomonas eustigma]|uniref:Uncharacterized protein n=1 Tax=Chlamydomonas eustigma TaxID=1157962 RepID=A0A250WXF1_9CHLO|nr:hypothetical protein CEUSTIGMA_g2956.t1 [Chlamydomonas eustigma]|eukprot:GAX75513.1 hypothetical protein CEUSTIGMA_g2956.t1 [Chlamydomonas eustigma]